MEAFCLLMQQQQQRTGSFPRPVSGLLVDAVKEPLSELPELSRRRLALLLQPHVVLPQVLHLLLQHRLVLFLLPSVERKTSVAEWEVEKMRPSICPFSIAA